LIAAVAVLSGCSRSVGNDDGLLTMPKEWQFGPSGDATVAVAGTAQLEGSCWYLVGLEPPRALIVWPNGSTWSDDQHTVVALPDGSLVASGTKIKGTGGEDDKAPSDASDLGPCLEDPPLVARFAEATLQ
jgi:hypothetical protein